VETNGGVVVRFAVVLAQLTHNKEVGGAATLVAPAARWLMLLAHHSQPEVTPEHDADAPLIPGMPQDCSARHLV
jgi:hypothetical protein